MQTIHYRRIFLGTTALAAGALGLSLTAAPAAAQSASPDPSMLDELIVTGSRIRGAGPIGSEAIVLDRDELLASGRAGAAELMKTVPQNFALGASAEARGSTQASPNNLGLASGVNLRGLGVDATLTLLNGRRLPQTNYGGFVDVSQIPLVAVERVEVLADGASAIYGSDAVGGVVNFVLRSDFEGAETSVRVGAGQGYDEVTVSQALGRRWSGGTLFAAVEYMDQSRLRARDRSYYTDDLRAYGGPDLRNLNASPGNIIAGGTTYAIPPGQSGRGLTGADLISGTLNADNRWADADILPEQTKLSAAATFSQDLGPATRVFFDGLSTRRISVRRGAPFLGTLTVPRSNPFFVSPVPGAATTSVRYSYAGDLPPQSPKAVTWDTTLSAGLEVRLPRDWRASAAGTFSRNTVELSYDAVNTTLLAQALADPDPARAFNPFGDAGSNGPAVLERIGGYYRNPTRLRTEAVNFEADGPLFRAPAGEVRLAVGGESRTETLRRYDVRFTSGLAPVSTQNRSERRIDALFAEALVPVFGPSNSRPGLESLVFSAAVRTERYSDVGRTTNPKLGVEWRPRADLKLSGSWGTSFKAPSLFQKDTSTNGSFVTTVPNAALPGGQATVIQFFGNSPGLKPEVADTWTAGVAYEPAWAQGLKFEAHYFRVKYSDRILSATSAEIASALGSATPSPIVLVRHPSAEQVAAAYADPTFRPTSGMPAADQIYAFVDFRERNLGSVEQTGLDIALSYRIDTSLGRFEASGAGVYIGKYAVARQPGDPAMDLKGTTSNPIDWHGRASLAWNRDAWSAGLSANFTGGYRNTTVAPEQDVPSWTTFDAQLAYEFEAQTGALAGVRVALDVQNLFDCDPPRVANAAGPFGYDSEQASALGRLTSLSLTKRW